jgi:hypothetical protein
MKYANKNWGGINKRKKEKKNAIKKMEKNDYLTRKTILTPHPKK